MRFAVHVHPGARRTVVGGRHGPEDSPALMARVAAPALDGRANAALIDALARAFNVRKSAVTIVAGAGHRTKIVEVNGIGSAAVHALMRAPAPPS